MLSYSTFNIKQTGVKQTMPAMLLGALLLVLGSMSASAQLTGFHASYFQNEYLNNPAMAGLNKGLNLDLGYQQLWTSVPGAPTLQNLTADYNSGNRVGLGLSVNADQSGLINHTRAMVTYAYHLPLNEKQDKLHFGLSAGISDTYINYNGIVGDAGDAEALAFNERSIYIDGDLGMAYTSRRLTLQATLPNLKSVFFPDKDERIDADRPTFFSAVSYLIPFDNEYNNFTLEPKVAFRGIKGSDNIVDAGLNLDMTKYNFSLSGMYHTNKTITLGAGLDLQAMVLLFAYTNNTGPIRNIANNTFELGLRIRVFR